MTSIHQFMSGDHRKCDQLFASAEKAVADKKWDRAREIFDEFHREMESHFHMEEDVLFVRFEAATGMVGGPTAVMRSEHESMRELFRSMDENVSDQNRKGYLGNSETLLYLMQQHNAKEEQMLYVMADRSMAESAGEIIEQMKQVQTR